MEKQNDPLIEAEKFVSALRKKAEEEAQLRQEHHSKLAKLDKELEELGKKQKQLSKKYQELAKKTAEFDKKTSSSRDARKMYGDVIPGDTTHQDVILLYQNYFKTTFRNLPRSLDKQSREEKYTVWELAATIIQKSFERNKEDIMSKMLSMTKSTLILDPTASVHKGPMLPEDKKFDIYRAFHVFVVEILKNDGLEVIKSTIKSDWVTTHEHWSEERVEAYVNFVKNIFLQLRPEDYYSFIEEGKGTEKFSAENTAQNACPSYKKGFKISKQGSKDGCAL